MVKWTCGGQESEMGDGRHFWRRQRGGKTGKHIHTRKKRWNYKKKRIAQFHFQRNDGFLWKTAVMKWTVILWGFPAHSGNTFSKCHIISGSQIEQKEAEWWFLVIFLGIIQIVNETSWFHGENIGTLTGDRKAIKGDKKHNKWYHLLSISKLFNFTVREEKVA